MSNLRNRKFRGCWLACDGSIISEVYEAQEFDDDEGFKGVVYEVFDGRQNSVEIIKNEREAIRRHFAIGFASVNGGYDSPADGTLRIRKEEYE